MTETAVLPVLESRLTHYLEDLRTLTAIDSGRDHKAGVDAINDWLTNRLTSLGCTVERYSQTEVGDNILATYRGNGSGRLLLLGHSDTVFPRGTAVSRPMSIQGNKLLAPGSCDMKAGLLTGLYALETLHQLGFTDFAAIHFLCVSDEESEPRPSLPLIREASRAADVVLTLEAARQNGDIVVARKGVRWLTIEAFGRAAHAGVEPEKGQSAILGLMKMLHTLVDDLNGWRKGVTLNVGTIEGGTLPNVVADYAKARLDIRAWNEETIDQLIEKIAAIVAPPSQSGVRFSYFIEMDSVTPAMPHTPAVAQLETIAKESAKALGFSLQGAKTGGASDAAYAAAEGVPVLDGLGPIGGLDHSPDEYIELDSIIPRTALLTLLMMRILESVNLSLSKRIK